MVGTNHEVRNRTHTIERQAHLQGMLNHLKDNGNYTANADLKASLTRYDKGLELYKSGLVSHHLPGNQQSIAHTRWITPG